MKKNQDIFSNLKKSVTKWNYYINTIVENLEELHI